MSLAQRRTAVEGIDTRDVLAGSENGNGNGNGSAPNGSQELANPSQEDVWRSLSYDPFGDKRAKIEHYESFPPETMDSLAAYEVSSFKRAGE
jgi:hypothetical protein